MISIVVDASAMVGYLLRIGRVDFVEETVTAPTVDVHAPALCDVEVIAALRRALRAGRMKEERAAMALEDYLDFPLARHGHGALLARSLALRENFTAYDAVYVALAESLGAALLTADAGLTRAVRRHTSVEALSAS